MSSRRSSHPEPKLVASAVAMAAALVLGGCSDATEDQEVIEGPEITRADDSTQLEAPVIVDSGDPVSLDVGQMIDVTTEDVTEVATSDASVLEVTQPRDDGSARFNAGATALVAGSATLTVYVDGEEAYTVDVTVGG